jgi:hypothetical protein
MNIADLAKTPELVQIVLDEEEIVSKYGDTVTFWTKNFVDINTYFKFFSEQADLKNGGIGGALKEMILTAEGTPAIPSDQDLPADLMLAVLGRLNKHLGK